MPELRTRPGFLRNCLIAGALAVGLVLAFVILPPLLRPRLTWPEHGVSVVPGGPEEVLNQALQAIAAGDLQAAAGLMTDRFGVPPTDVAKTLAEGIGRAGRLRRWLIVSTEPGEPVICTVYVSFSRAGDTVLKAEMYADPAGWRFGNLRANLTGWKPPTWEVAVTDRVRILAWPGCRDDLEMLLVRAEPGYDQALAPFLAGRPRYAGFPGRVSVYVYDSLATLESALGASLQSWTIGLFSGGAVHLVSPTGVRGRQIDLYEIFVHELNHGLLIQYCTERSGRPVRLPAWLWEGTAGLAAGQLSGERRAGLAAEAKYHAPPGLADLAMGFDVNQVPFRYEYAFSLAEYLTHEHGADALVRVLDLMCDGETADDALYAVTELSRTTLETKWHEWLARGLTW